MTVQLQHTGAGSAHGLATVIPAAAHGLATGAWLQRSLCAPPPPAWTSAALGGCLAELSGEPGAPSLTLAFGLVRQVQQQGEPVAWLARADSTFYPPDAAEGGVDLAALPVIRLASVRQRLQAAEQLARAGAFGLLVIDLGACLDLPLAAQTRLADQGRCPRHAHPVPDGQDRAAAVARVACRGAWPCTADPPRGGPFRLPGAGAQGQAARSRLDRRGMVSWTGRPVLICRRFRCRSS